MYKSKSNNPIREREREREPMVLPPLWLSPWPLRLPRFTRADGFNLFRFTRVIESRWSRHRRLNPSMASGMKGLGL